MQIRSLGQNLIDKILSELIGVVLLGHFIVESVMKPLASVVGSLGAGLRVVHCNHGVVHGGLTWQSVFLDERDTDGGHEVEDASKSGETGGHLLGEVGSLARDEDIRSGVG